MNKRRLKLDFFAILHPLFLIMLGLLFYLFAFILIWFITGLVEMIQGKMDFHTLYFYSLLISLLCSVLFIMYVAGFIAQLIIHLCHQREKTLLPVWCMLTAVLVLVPVFEEFSLLGSTLNFKGYFLSIVAYIAYLFTKIPKVIEGYRRLSIPCDNSLCCLGGFGAGHYLIDVIDISSLSKQLRVLSFLQAY